MALSLAAPAFADPEADAKELLTMWAPKSVQVKNGILTVALPQRRVTEEIYMAVMTAGLCPGVLLDKPLEGVREIHILNEHKVQGYVYEKGLEDCAEFNEMPAGDNRVPLGILGATHLF